MCNESTYPQEILTDGGWTWFGALWYYVREYHLCLPQEFPNHAESRHWQIEAALIDPVHLDSDALFEVP